MIPKKSLKTNEYEIIIICSNIVILKIRQLFTNQKELINNYDRKDQNESIIYFQNENLYYKANMVSFDPARSDLCRRTNIELVSRDSFQRNMCIGSDENNRIFQKIGI